MADRGIGTCTECGAEDVEITVIDEETMLCDECLEQADVLECDECGEIYFCGYVKFYRLKDGRRLCEDCYENALEEEEISEDDVENVIEDE